MKIAFLKSHFSTLGGLEKYTLRLAHRFAKEGHEVFLLTTSHPSVPLPSPEGVTVISLCARAPFSFYHLFRFNRLANQWLKKNRCDIVFGNDRNTQQTHYRAGNGSHAAYLHQRRLVSSFLQPLLFRINPLHRLILSYEKKAFEHPDLKILFTPSSMVKDQILNTYAISQEKVVVVHNGVEWSELHDPFHLSFPKEKWRRTLGLNPKCYQLLFIGNGYLRKGLLFLLDALALLGEKKIELSVIGTDKNMAFFSSYAKKKGLEEQVKFFGKQKNVFPFYSAADSLFIPSLYDPFANVTLEALSMGLFVVSSPYNGGGEILSPHSGHLLKKPLDAHSLMEGVKIALNHPKEEASALSIRQSVKELDFSTQLDKIVSLTISTTISSA